MVTVWIAEEGGLTEGFVVEGKTTEGILTRDIWDVREGSQAGGIDEAGGGKGLGAGVAGDLPLFVGEFGDVGDGGIEMDASTEGSVVVDVGIKVRFQVCCDVLCREEIIVLL